MTEETKINTESISFRWYDHCSGKEMCYNINKEVDYYEPIDTPVFANDSMNGHERHDTVVVKDSSIYLRKITAELRDGFQVGTIFWAKEDESRRYYITNFVKKGTNGGLIYKFRRLDHSDPVDTDLLYFEKDKVLLVRGFIHDKTD